MDKNDKIYVAGHRGLVGSAIVRMLTNQGYSNLLVRTSSELDLTQQRDVQDFFAEEKPDYVILAAAKVGGILANDTYPAEFIYNNLMIEANVIHASYLNNVKKLLALGSTCIYPKYAEQPMKEECLLSGPLEPTNEWYAVAKIAGIKMCQAYQRQYGCRFISAMPTNLYGPGDNFDLKNSHVLPAMLARFHHAKISNIPEVKIWGTGKPRREFLHVDDMAEACMFLMQNYEEPEIVNIGTGEDITIKNLAEIVKTIVGYEGEIRLDETKPDGTPRKLVDTTKINKLGWTYTIGLKDGISTAYEWYLNNIDVARGGSKNT